MQLPPKEGDHRWPCCTYTILRDWPTCWLSQERSHRRRSALPRSAHMHELGSADVAKFALRPGHRYSQHVAPTPSASCDARGPNANQSIFKRRRGRSDDIAALERQPFDASRHLPPLERVTGTSHPAPKDGSCALKVFPRIRRREGADCNYVQKYESRRREHEVGWIDSAGHIGR